VHSSFRSRDASLVRTASRDRYVVLLSHHGYAHLSNPRGEKRADELLRLLARFGNVVLWLNGHTHMNLIVARKGFWEVTTGSIVDWPCQARVIELFETTGGALASASPCSTTTGGLAELHRGWRPRAVEVQRRQRGQAGGPQRDPSSPGRLTPSPHRGSERAKLALSTWRCV
jgi:hypothetical protein